MKKILETKNLTKIFKSKKTWFGNERKIHAVNNLNISLDENQTLGIVGESGCGKSTLARMLVGLIDSTSGSINLFDKNINDYSKLDIAKNIQYVFQDPISSLNPRKTIYQSLVDPLDNLTNLNNAEKKEHILNIFKEVNLNENLLYRYPHEFSGGQAQRIAIARALLAKPKIIVLDEPVSALDVSIQSQILNLLNQLKDQFNLSYIFISHDLSIVEKICDKVSVMYFGSIVEESDSNTIFSKPRHPYTQLLANSVPLINKKVDYKIQYTELPDPSNPPINCSFYERCSVRKDKCNKEQPTLLGNHNKVSCFNPIGYEN